jgi:DNA-directed RNA polymerase specialized sigma54-like protein
MKLGLQHSARMEQRLVQSPQMIQAMQILQLSRMDLQERIEQELLENPFLEQAEVGSPGDEEARPGRQDERGEEPAQPDARDAIAEEFERWREFEDGRGRPTAAGREASDRKLEAMANTPDRPKSLAAALVDQLAMIDFTPLQRELAEYLIYSLDPRGYLPEGIEGVAELFAAAGGLDLEDSGREPSESERAASEATSDGGASEAATSDAAGAGSSAPRPEDPGASSQEPLGDAETASTTANAASGAASDPAEDPSRGEGTIELDSLQTLAYRVLGRLRRATHPALGARDLRESLALQLEARGETDELLYTIVEDHLDDLMRNRLPHVAKATGAEVDDVKQALEVLRELDPSPGGEFGEEVAEAIVPDVFVALVEDELVVQLASDRLPPLQLSPSSEDLLKALEVAVADGGLEDGASKGSMASSSSSDGAESRGGDDAVEEAGDGASEERSEIRGDAHVERNAAETDGEHGNESGEGETDEGRTHRGPRAELTADEDPRRWGRRRLEAARWFMEAVIQREKTVLRVAKAVFRHQRGFLERGPKWLQPLRMQEIADETGVHISTVSRAVAGKYAQTPRGIYPLKYFFTSSTRDKSGTQASQVSVQQRLQEIVDREDKQKPLSDDQLAAELERTSGIKIARRTVTKYRKSLGIGSSTQRKEY